MINSNRILEKKRFPYPYIIIQNFFEKEFYKNIENDFPKKESFLDYPNNLKRMHFDTTYGDDAIKFIKYMENEVGSCARLENIIMDKIR